MKDILIYSLIAAVSLFMMGYSIHMLVGGIVAPDTEKRLILGAILAGLVALGFMARDIAKRKKG